MNRGREAGWQVVSVSVLTHKIIEIHSGKKMYAKNLLEGAAAALKLGRGWPEDSPQKEEMVSL